MKIVLIPSKEGQEGMLCFAAPDEMPPEAIKSLVASAVANANDDNGERSDEVIKAVEDGGLTFVGNPHTESVIVTDPWI